MLTTKLSGNNATSDFVLLLPITIENILLCEIFKLPAIANLLDLVIFPPVYSTAGSLSTKTSLIQNNHQSTPWHPKVANPKVMTLLSILLPLSLSLASSVCVCVCVCVCACVCVCMHVCVHTSNQLKINYTTISFYSAVI